MYGKLQWIIIYLIIKQWIIHYKTHDTKGSKVWLIFDVNDKRVILLLLFGNYHTNKIFYYYTTWNMVEN